MASIPSGKFLRQLFLSVAAMMLAFGGKGYPEGAANSSNLLTQVQVIPLDGVEGRIDHLGLDAKGRRLFVAALGNDTVEVVDLVAGKVPSAQLPAYVDDVLEYANLAAFQSSCACGSACS